MREVTCHRLLHSTLHLTNKAEKDKRIKATTLSIILLLDFKVINIRVFDNPNQISSNPLPALKPNLMLFYYYYYHILLFDLFLEVDLSPSGLRKCTVQCSVHPSHVTPKTPHEQQCVCCSRIKVKYYDDNT